jgi:signal transduction histidine kinase
MKTEGDEKKLILKFEDHPDNLEIFGDRDKIYDVILNLLDNAVKYTPAGKVVLKLLVNEKNKIHFSVADTGIGIPSNELDELFTKFKRGEKISQINTSGSGLGLFIAKKIVELHGGRVWAFSKGEGKGSEFGFEIPIKN